MHLIDSSKQVFLKVLDLYVIVIFFLQIIVQAIKIVTMIYFDDFPLCTFSSLYSQ